MENSKATKPVRITGASAAAVPAVVAAPVLSYGAIPERDARREQAWLFQDAEAAEEESELLPFVRFTDRDLRSGTMDRAARVIFTACLICHVAFCTYFMAARNACVSELEGICPGSRLRTEYDRCVQQYPLPPLIRSLTEHAPASTASSANVLYIFQQHAWIPLVVICALPLMLLVWFKLLASAARVVAWLSIVFGSVVYIIFGVKMDESGASSVGIAFIVYGVLLLAVTVISLHRSIDKAARSLQIGSTMLLQNPYILLAAGLLEVLMLVSMVISVKAIADSYQIWTIVDTGSRCELHIMPRMVYLLRSFCILFLTWLVLFFDGAKLVTTSMSIGNEIFMKNQFHVQESAAKYPFRALGTVLTTSVGTIAIGSLVVAAVERWISHSRKGNAMWIMSVRGCIYHYVLSYCEQFWAAMNRFALIAHAFSGDGFMVSSRRAYTVLSRNFEASIVADQVGSYVLQSAAKAVSLFFVLLTWFLVDEAQGWHSLSNIIGVFNNSSFGVAIFMALVVTIIDYPLFGVILIAWFQETLVSMICSSAASCEIQAPLAGLFMGCVARILFNFQASVLLHALDSVFVAYAISKDTRVKLADERFYVLVENSGKLL